jgi:CRISPR/Cas system-associated endonuclease Cas1
MNMKNRFMQNVKDYFDEEKRLEKSKSILKNKIDKIKRTEKARKEIEALETELDKLKNGRPKEVNL